MEEPAQARDQAADILAEASFGDDPDRLTRNRRSEPLAISAAASAAENGRFRSADLQSHAAGIGSTCPEGTVSSGSRGSVN
jgi:hypothetical protein